MPKLLEQTRDQLRTRYYSYRTEQAYLQWIKQFILFHDKRHPSLLGSDEIGNFLTHSQMRTPSGFTSDRYKFSHPRALPGGGIGERFQRFAQSQHYVSAFIMFCAKGPDALLARDSVRSCKFVERFLSIRGS